MDFIPERTDSPEWTNLLLYDRIGIKNPRVKEVWNHMLWHFNVASMKFWAEKKCKLRKRNLIID